jgi:hypothetical protein
MNTSIGDIYNNLLYNDICDLQDKDIQIKEIWVKRYYGDRLGSTYYIDTKKVIHTYMSYMVRLKPDMVYDYLIIIESDK